MESLLSYWLIRRLLGPVQIVGLLNERAPASYCTEHPMCLCDDVPLASSSSSSLHSHHVGRRATTTERFRHVNFGHMEVDVTITDNG